MFEVAGQNLVHPIGLAALLACCIFVLFFDRPVVFLVVFSFLALIPSAQRVVVLGADFSFIRILILLALLRSFAKSHWGGFLRIKPDNLLLSWMVWSFISYLILYGSPNAVVTRFGYMVEAVGAYFVGRLYVKSWGDFRRSIVFLLYLSIPVVYIFLMENQTGRNLFHVFGGINEMTEVREGKIRSQGPFTHSIMAGMFWVSMFPFLAITWINREVPKVILYLSCFSMLAIVISTASSTPVMALLIIFLALLFYKAKSFLPFVKWFVLIVLVFSQLVLTHGAASLLAKVNIFAGSTGWHRYHLIDEAINHFFEWFLFGTKATSHWGWGLGDVTNQYILEGVRGGFLGMFLFSYFLWSVLSALGSAIKHSKNDLTTWMYWCFGSWLIMHLFSFLSVSYFDQMVSAFFFMIGAIVSIVQNRPRDDSGLTYSGAIKV
jgi:hypothetical protein